MFRNIQACPLLLKIVHYSHTAVAYIYKIVHNISTVHIYLVLSYCINFIYIHKTTKVQMEENPKPHLFAGPMVQASLTAGDLWSNPVAVADLLQLWTDALGATGCIARSGLNWDRTGIKLTNYIYISIYNFFFSKLDKM